jgi:hypothetical protein
MPPKTWEAFPSILRSIIKWQRKKAKWSWHKFLGCDEATGSAFPLLIELWHYQPPLAWWNDTNGRQERTRNSCNYSTSFAVFEAAIDTATIVGSKWQKKSTIKPNPRRVKDREKAGYTMEDAIRAKWEWRRLREELHFAIFQITCSCSPNSFVQSKCELLMLPSRPNNKKFNPNITTIMYIWWSRLFGYGSHVENMLDHERRACVASNDVAAAIASDEKVQLRNIPMNPSWNSWCRREGLW